jgi:hypothetical protein
MNWSRPMSALARLHVLARSATTFAQQLVVAGTVIADAEENGTRHRAERSLAGVAPSNDGRIAT